MRSKKMSRSRSCALADIDEEKCVHRKPHFFSTGLSGVNFSWSFVMRGTLLSASRSSAGSSSARSWTSGSNEYTGSPSVSRSSSLTVSSKSDASTGSSMSSSRSNSRTWRSLWSFGWRKRHKRDKRVEQQEQKTSLLLDRLPFTESGKFLTVYVGVRSDQIVKYVVRRSLVTHPLVQVMLQVSENEFGDECAENGVSIVCDPELFLEVVKAIHGNLDSIRKVDPEPEETVLIRPGDGPETSVELQAGPS